MKIRILLLLVIFCITLNAQQKDTTQTRWNIDNCVNRFKKEKIQPTKAGYQYWFADPNFANGRSLKMSVVKPGDATHPPHKHIEDEFFFILEGTAKFYLNGDSTVCGPYTSFYCPSMVEHGIRNAGDTELKYLVIKDYPVKKK
ncbi:MAG: cupin domain-containing protein [Paludibacter sp.]|nr:cupin domain-containing protein [Paludibacter sp.]